MNNQNVESFLLTDIDKSAGGALAEHFRLVRQGHLDHPGDVSGRGLHTDGMARNQLTPHQHGPEHHLQEKC